MITSRVAASAAMVLSLCACAPRPKALTLATTTSVANSGLLDPLSAAYAADTGISVKSHLVGSGRALAMLAQGTADVAITHAPAAETLAIREHPHWRYAKIMFNEFVIVGPPGDPAGVAGASSASEAMGRIARRGQRFISRGDDSGTHERERALWTEAGAAPPAGALVVAGSGMGTTLRIAGETASYTLTDRATYIQQAATLPLTIVFEGGQSLLNTYAVVFDPAGPAARDAAAFAEWLSSGKGRDRIAAYRAKGVPVFFTWPHDRPRASPADVP